MSPISPPPGTDWPPAAQFIPAESAVEGITVYAPRPEPVVEETGPASFKCPQCGASTRYDVAAGGVACEHCGYCAPSTQEVLGLAAEEYEFTVETWNQAEKGWGVSRQELFCESCGAVITLSEHALTATCPFCASNQVHVRVAPEEVLRPRFIVPFKVNRETVRATAVEWLGKGWFHPAELRSSAVVDRFHGIYLPFWTFDARIRADWRAEVGYQRQERYYDAGSKDWKTRTRIDWRWEDGQVTLKIDDHLLSGSSRLSRIILERLYPYNLKELVAYQADFIAGWQAQAFDVTLTQAWDLAKSQMREQSKQACYEDIPSHHVRNFTMSADFSDEVWRYILLPVYLAAYRFEEKTYQVMVNGQTGVVAGQKPVAWWKVWLAVAALLAPGILLGLIGLPLAALGGLGAILLVVGFVLLLIGGAISVAIYRQAVASEAA